MVPAPAVGFREAVAGDAGWLATFGRRIFDATFGPHNAAEDMRTYLEMHYSLERQAAEIARPRSKIWIAELEGTRVGYTQLMLDAPRVELAGEPATEVNRFYVDAAWHGRGIAAAMMAHCFEESRTLGARWTWLAVWSKNERAIAFYRKAGFEKIGEQIFVLGTDRQRDWVMARDLRAASGSTGQRETSEGRAE